MEIFSACCLVDDKDILSVEAMKTSALISIEWVHDTSRSIVIEPQQAIELAKAILSYYEDN